MLKTTRGSISLSDKIVSSNTSIYSQRETKNYRDALKIFTNLNTLTLQSRQAGAINACVFLPNRETMGPLLNGESKLLAGDAKKAKLLNDCLALVFTKIQAVTRQLRKLLCIKKRQRAADHDK